MPDSVFIRNLHNVSNLVYHFVCPTKYHYVVIVQAVDKTLKQMCEGIEASYDWIKFLEIGVNEDHVHFLIQKVFECSVRNVRRTFLGSVPE